MNRKAIYLLFKNSNFSQVEHILKQTILKLKNKSKLTFLIDQKDLQKIHDFLNRVFKKLINLKFKNISIQNSL